MGGRMTNAGNLLGLGSLVGAGVGGIGGSIQGYRDARAEGAGTGGALMKGVLGGVQGGAVGGVAGAALGGAGGALVKRDLLPGLAQSNNALGSFARFGQRQLHGFAGHLSPQELEGVRGGAYGARLANDALPVGAKGKDSAEAAFHAERDIQNRGMTSIPGVFRAVTGDDPVGAARAAGRYQMAGSGIGMKALNIGLPAVGLANAAHGGESATRGERIGEEAGRTIGGVLGSPLPFVGGMALGEVAGKAGKYLGRGVDRFRRGAAPPPGAPMAEAIAHGPHIPVERTMSPSVAGTAPGAGL